MPLSVRQYAVLFGVLILLLVSTFAYQIHSNLQDTRQIIENSQIEAAINELNHAVSFSIKSIRDSADGLAQWEEVKQQIDNPDIFAYWYNVRFRHPSFELQQYTSDMMLYNVDGKALAQLDDNKLPAEIDTRGIDVFSFRIINDNDIIYLNPIFGDPQGKTIIGYLSAHIHLLQLIKSISHSQHIQADTLRLKVTNPFRYLDSLTAENFTYNVRRSNSILVLETQIKDSILELVFIIVIPTLILYAVLAIIIGTPVQHLNSYINQLRKTPGDIVEKNHHHYFRVAELDSVYQSLNSYHTELSQKEEYLSLTLNSIGDAVITTDAETRIVRMNPVATQLTGWALEEAINKPVNEIFHIVHASSKQIVERPFERVVSEGQTLHLSKDIILISKDGTEYFIADSAAPIRDSKANIRGLVLVFNDITEQKKKEEQLQHSLKMDALGNLTGGIAHDFNNMLGVILGYSELLINQLGDKPRQLDYAEHIYNAGERARKLTSKLLAFSRKEASEATATELNDSLRAEQHMLEKTLTARVELKLQLEDDLWPVYLDQGQLQDSILNISINAMHAMPNGGVLTVNTRNVHIDSTDKYHIDLTPGDYVQLSFTDTGCGMDRETQQKIFDPFFSTKGDQGTGLGMSQVYGFVQQSGGAIHVYSEPGHGTRIAIYLPRYLGDEQSEAAKQQHRANNQDIPGGNENILVVDDEPGLLELSCQILGDNGYNVLCAGSAEEALDILEKQAVDLLLTDVIMPRMDGYQLASRVMKKYPQIKIQMISGFSDDRNRTSDDDRLHKRLLHKPFSSQDLLRRIRETLDN